MSKELEINPADKTSFVPNDSVIIAEHLVEVYDIDNIIRTRQAKIMNAMISADQSENGYNQRTRLRIEYEFYTELHNSIKELRRKQLKNRKIN